MGYKLQRRCWEGEEVWRRRKAKQWDTFDWKTGRKTLIGEGHAREEKGKRRRRQNRSKFCLKCHNETSYFICWLNELVIWKNDSSFQLNCSFWGMECDNLLPSTLCVLEQFLNVIDLWIKLDILHLILNKIIAFLLARLGSQQCHLNSLPSLHAASIKSYPSRRWTISLCHVGQRHWKATF